MLKLDTVNKSLEIKLAGAVATTELPFVCSYSDGNQSTMAVSGWSSSDGTTNGSTAATVAAAPAATTTRQIQYLSVVNVDTAAVTLSVQVNSSATKRIVFKATLQIGDQLSFTDALGWTVYDTNGNEKTTMQNAANSVTVAMLQQVVTASVLGRNTAGTGNVEVLTTIPAGTLAGRSLADLGTRAVANLSDGSNVALLNAGNVFTANQQTFIAELASSNVFKIRGRSSDDLATAGFYNNAGSTLQGYFATGPSYFILSSVTGYLSVSASSYVEFDTNSLARVTISSAGAVRFHTYGVGTATFDASGNITSVSDERLKDVDGTFTTGLAAVLKIQPIRYHYKVSTGLDTQNEYVGFSAQQVLPYLPQAVGEGPDGFYTFNDRALLAAVVNAMHQLQDEIDDLRAATNLPIFDRTVQIHTHGEGRIISRRD